MYYKTVLLCIIIFSTKIHSKEIIKKQSKGIVEEQFTKFRKCVLPTINTSCILNIAEEFLSRKAKNLLLEADLQALNTIKGRDENAAAPSQLFSTISRIFSELTSLLKETLFPSSKESTDGLKNVENNKTDTKQIMEEGRAKKKKEKIKAIIKLLILGIVLKAKLTLLLKLLAAKLQIKFFLVALASLILNAARFYIDLKKSHHPQKVIYYEHAQHQHHYDGAEEDWGHGDDTSSFWGRNDQDESDGYYYKPSAQYLAYAKQRPAYSKTQGAPPSNSWWW